MGTSVKCEQSDTRQESKQDMEVVTEAAAAITVNVAHLQVWVGANAENVGRNADIIRALDLCFQRLRLAGFPADDSTQLARMVPGEASSEITFEILGGNPVGVTEDEVIVLYEIETFDNPNTGDGRPGASELFKGIYEKVKERYIEERKAA